MSFTDGLAAFAADLEARARAAESVAELGFSMANDAHAALHYRQALVLDAKGGVLTVSGLARPGDDSPYLLWLKRTWPWVAGQLRARRRARTQAALLSPAVSPAVSSAAPIVGAGGTASTAAQDSEAAAAAAHAGMHAAPHAAAPGDANDATHDEADDDIHADAAGWFAPSADLLAAAPGDVADGWQEWWPAGLLALHLKRRNGATLGWVVFLLDTPPPQEIAAMLDRASRTWAYCWEMLAGTPHIDLKARWRALDVKRRRLILGAAAAFFLLPVRQTALAPAEVTAVDAMAITAAVDGVVKTVHVRPNQMVKAGEPLFSLDDTTLGNRLEVAKKSVAVADAELLAATQMAFEDSRSKAELATLTGRAQERRAELAAAQAQLERIQALAPYDGVAVFADPDEWQGRPVVAGERIMLLANPAKPGMLIHLPVADAIALDAGARVKLFLTVRPLSPLAGEITETSYQATVSPDGVASYRLRASVEDSDARIGLRGTAKLYGGWVVLGYYLMRRPLAKLREWSGW